MNLKFMPIMAKSKKPGKKSDKESQLDLFRSQGNNSSVSAIEQGPDSHHSRVISFDQYKGQMLVKRFYEEAEKLTKHLK